MHLVMQIEGYFHFFPQINSQVAKASFYIALSILNHAHVKKHNYSS